MGVKKLNPLLVFPMLWILVALIWLISFPLHPEEGRIDYEDVLIEGLFLGTAILVFFALKKLPKVMFGWGVFVSPLITDWLDEFTFEPEFFDTTLEGILKILGLILILIGFFRSYRELEEKKEIIEESFKWFRNLVEIAPIPMVVYDKGGFVYTNRAAQEISGYSREELQGGIFWELFDEKEKEKMKEVITRRLRGEKIEPYTLKIGRKDDTYRTLISHGTTMSSGGKSYGIVALTDITELEEKRRQVEDLSKMLSLINRILRHDLLNALSSATAYTELYKERESDEHLNKVGQSIDRAVMILKNLEKFEDTVRAGELKIVNVREVAKEISKNFTLPIEIEGECNVIADEGLATVFENII